jgi:DCN1-like protein 4/5
LTAKWVTFIESKKHDVSKDNWNMILDLFEETNGDLSQFDEMGSWPVLIDEFVEIERAGSN